MTEWINEDCEWLEEFQLDIKYKSSKYLSLCYFNIWKDNRGEDNCMNNFLRICVTIDMQTGERVYLDDLIKDTDNLKQKLMDYDYGNEYSPPINSEEIIHYASISEKEYYEEIYKTDPLVYDFMESYLYFRPSFYLTDNYLVITRDRYEWDDVYIDLEQ